MTFVSQPSHQLHWGPFSTTEKLHLPSFIPVWSIFLLLQTPTVGHGEFVSYLSALPRETNMNCTFRLSDIRMAFGKTSPPSRGVIQQVSHNARLCGISLIPVVSLLPKFLARITLHWLTQRLQVSPGIARVSITPLLSLIDIYCSNFVRHEISRDVSSEIIPARNICDKLIILQQHLPTIYSTSDPYPVAILSGNRLPDGSPIPEGHRGYSNSSTLKVLLNTRLIQFSINSLKLIAWFFLRG